MKRVKTLFKKRPYISPTEAGELLGVTYTTIHDWIRRGMLQAWTTAGGHRRLTLESVEALLRKREDELLQWSQVNPFVTLIVEDDANMLEVYKKHLNSWKLPMKIIGACNGMDGFLHVAKDRPHMIITDLVMPDLDGVEMIRRIKNDSELKKIQILVVTVLSDAEIEARGGIPEEITIFKKPVSFTKIKNEIYNVMGITKFSDADQGVHNIQ